MSDDSKGSSGQRSGADPEGGGRRAVDRRREQKPFAGEDRRKGDRRTEADRRASQRSEDGLTSDES